MPGCAATKEECIEALPRAIEKSLPNVKRLKDLLADDSTPHDSFEAIDTMISAATRENLYMLEDGSRARVYMSNNYLMISRYARSIIHDYFYHLEYDGSYHGEGPVHVVPEMSFEEAEATLKEFLQTIGLDGYTYTDPRPARNFDKLAFVELNCGWNFTVMRSHEYYPVDVYKYQEYVETPDSDFFSPYLGNEILQIYVGPSGVEFLSWQYPFKVLECSNENIELMSFENLVIAARSVVNAKNAYYAEIETLFAWTEKTECAYLTQFVVPVKTSPSMPTLFPAGPLL